MPNISKGQTAPLNVTKEAQHRIVAGLGWDPAQPGLIEKMQNIAGLKDIRHDLDLWCFIYNKDGEKIDLVSADSDHAIDSSEKIYHSGDNTEGYGEGDDEEISVELKDLPTNIHSLIFAAFIKTGYTFQDINMPEIRLADGYTNHTLLASALGQDEDAAQDGYLFCKLQRADKDEWNVSFIDEYFKSDSHLEDENFIQQYI